MNLIKPSTVMLMIIRYPTIHEIGETASVLYSAFKTDFGYLFGSDYEYGRKLFVNLYKQTIKKKHLHNFLIAIMDGTIVGATHLDFENPRLIDFFFFFIKMTLHFFRSYSKLGLRKAFKITVGMYWFLSEDFNTNTSYIKLLGVLPQYQNRGIGRRILETVEKITKRRKLPSMTLDTSFEDFPARHLYTKLGFVVTRSFQISFLKYLNGIEGVLSMEKQLDIGGS